MYAIWKDIYGSSNFKNFCASSGMYASNRVPSGYSSLKDAYPDLAIMELAVEHNGNVPIPDVPDWSLDDDHPDVIAYSNAQKAVAYYDSAFTTVNLGIPYMDDEIVNKMYSNVIATLKTFSPPFISIL